jgi:hypothetical protein
MIRMAALVFLLQTLSALSAQLDVALVQFPEVKTAEELNTALEGAILSDMTNSNRLITRNPILNGGVVLFAQSLSPTASLQTSTRLEAARVDLVGTLQNNSLNVEIRISEGVQGGLHRFVSRSFAGSAPLSAGTARVLSLRTIKGKTNSVSKGKSEVKESITCHAIIAQLR